MKVESTSTRNEGFYYSKECERFVTETHGTGMYPGECLMFLYDKDKNTAHVGRLSDWGLIKPVAEEFVREGTVPDEFREDPLALKTYYQLHEMKTNNRP